MTKTKPRKRTKKTTEGNAVKIEPKIEEPEIFSMLPAELGPNPENFFTEETLARHLGLAPITLRLWRRKATGPKYVKFGQRLVRYTRADVDAWVAKQTIGLG